MVIRFERSQHNVAWEEINRAAHTLGLRNYKILAEEASNGTLLWVVEADLDTEILANVHVPEAIRG